MTEPVAVYNPPVGETWEPTLNFRWVQTSATTTKPPRLQQQFRVTEQRRHSIGGDTRLEWNDVPLVVED